MTALKSSRRIQSLFAVNPSAILRLGLWMALSIVTMKDAGSCAEPEDGGEGIFIADAVGNLIAGIWLTPGKLS